MTLPAPGSGATDARADRTGQSRILPAALLPGAEVVTSVGIHNAGERDTNDNLANVLTDMRRELDTINSPVPLQPAHNTRSLAETGARPLEHGGLPLDP